MVPGEEGRTSEYTQGRCVFSDPRATYGKYSSLSFAFSGCTPDDFAFCEPTY